MFGMSDAHHFRKMVAGFCMVVAPLFALVAFIVHPGAETKEAAQIAQAAAHADAWYAAHLFLFISLVLAVPVVLGFMHMLREREVAYGHAGGVLGLVGLIATAVIIGIQMVVWQMGVSGNGTEMAGLLDRVNNADGVMIPFYFGSLLVGLAYVAFAVGLYRAHVIAPWMALCLACGGILLDAGSMTTNITLAVVGAAVLVVGQGAMGWLVWKETDDAWDRTPDYTGMTALPGMR
jgi:hypothetical protein